MPAGEPDFCDGKFALTLYIAVTPSNFGNRAGVETDAKGTLRQLNSRLESLIGISLFLRRKSKILRSISLFPCRKSQIPCSISLSPKFGTFRFFRTENAKLRGALLTFRVKNPRFRI